MKGLKLSKKRLQSFNQSLFKAAFFLILTLSSCNYHSTLLFEDTQTMGIEFIKEDSLGKLRTYLVQEMEKSPLFKYEDKGPRFMAHIELLKHEDEEIGFQYASSLTSTSKRLVVNEKRKWVKARVSIMDQQDKKVIAEPQEVLAAIEFDFDPEDSDDKFTIIGPNLVPMISFSMGEFVSEQNAKPIAEDLLMQILAKRIVDYITCQKIYMTPK
jgi:hypothetical protein